MVVKTVNLVRMALIIGLAILASIPALIS